MLNSQRIADAMLFTTTLACPHCFRTGNAEIAQFSDQDDPRIELRNHLPSFSLVQAGATLAQTKFRCVCGEDFLGRGF